jgi:hypothetical protein
LKINAGSYCSIMGNALKIAAHIMPIVGPTSYFSVTQSFINHWNDANTALGSAITLDKNEIEASADAVVATLITLLGDLEGKRDVVEDITQDVSIKRAFSDGMRAFLLVKINDFNDMMRAEHGSSIYGQSLAAVPGISAGRDAFMKPFRDSVRLWAKVNTWRATLGKGALLTKGGFDQGAFNSAVSQARIALDDLEEVEQQLSIDIRKRDSVQNLIYPILRVYRLKVVAVFSEGHPMIGTLPALTPEPGSTPAAPGLAIAWNNTISKAEGSGTASPSAGVAQYQVRGVVGPDHNPNTEVVVLTIQAGQPLAFTTTWSLVTPGAVASFRLVAMTADGHERGSEPVVVSRPM